MNDDAGIESVLREDRVFPPPAGFSESVGGAWIASMADYESRYRRSIDDPESFWGEAAREYRWMKPFTTVLEWNCPDARWFADGT
ncbi:MAG: acetyl-coenzyme A synthetase, partial [Phycisphaeraceae bacterium]|nr:acetyl-coenzyme A synthetase [Phycisphaeraceae bacterium]